MEFKKISKSYVAAKSLPNFRTKDVTLKDNTKITQGKIKKGFFERKYASRVQVHQGPTGILKGVAAEPGIKSIGKSQRQKERYETLLNILQANSFEQEKTEITYKLNALLRMLFNGNETLPYAQGSISYKQMEKLDAIIKELEKSTTAPRPQGIAGTLQKLIDIEQNTRQTALFINEFQKYYPRPNLKTLNDCGTFIHNKLQEIYPALKDVPEPPKTTLQEIKTLWQDQTWCGHKIEPFKQPNTQVLRMVLEYSLKRIGFLSLLPNDEPL